MDPAQPKANPCDADTMRAALDRVLSSRLFQQSETHSRFLRHLVQHAIEGSTDKLKEYTVGVDVFSRGASFDPRHDSIVRVEASRLRTRLSEYYVSQGKDDPLRIEIPKGAYTPEFHIVVLPATQETASRAAEARRVGRVVWAGLAVCLGGVVALASIGVLRNSHPNQPPSVAVLPFVSLGSDQRADYFSDGITEEITNVLGRIPNLRVVSRSSAFRFKGSGADVREVGRQLGVATVLEGSVRRSEGTLRIAVQLISAADGYALWSASYDREEKDILSIQGSIAESIAGNLRLRLADSDSHAFSRPATRSPAAHDLVLQARYMHPDAGDPDARIRCYQRALELDSNYAPAYVGLGDEWLRHAVEGATAPRDVMENARDAARKALLIDDSLPDAHFLSASVKWMYDWDWPGAEREFDRALRLNPNSAATRTQYARYLALLGRRQDALSQLAQIRVLDPISPATSSIEASVYYLVGDYDRTIQHARAVLAGEPDLWLMYYWMGRAHDSKGHLAEAAAALEKWHGLPGRLQGSGFGMLGSVYARAGRRADAMRLLNDAMAHSKRSHVSPTSVALLYAGLGDSGQAMEWLEKAYQERDHSLVAIKSDPAYDSLRGDPRFVALLRRMKL